VNLPSQVILDLSYDKMRIGVGFLYDNLADIVK